MAVPTVDSRSRNGFYSVRSICYTATVVYVLLAAAAIVLLIDEQFEPIPLWTMVVSSFVAALLFYLGGRVAGAMGDLCVDVAGVRAGIQSLLLNPPADALAETGRRMPPQQVPTDYFTEQTKTSLGQPISTSYDEAFDDDAPIEHIDDTISQTSRLASPEEPTPSPQSKPVWRVRGVLKEDGKRHTARIAASSEESARIKAYHHFAEVFSIEREGPGADDV